MTPITPASTWDTVNEYDLTDPVLGGDTGQSNIPVKQLANRTQFIYDRLWFKDVAVVDATGGGAALVYTIDNTFSFKLIKILSNKNLEFALDDVANFIKGTVIVFKCKNTIIKTHTISPFGANVLNDGSLSFTKVYMCDGETLVLSADPDNHAWDILVHPENMYLAGEDDLVRNMPRNSVVADGVASGSLPLRADYARVWDKISGIAIPDSTWLSDPFRFKGFFSQGNSAANFRWPDLRGMAAIALDMGRGVSFSRFDSQPGAYEPDAIIDHKHQIIITPNSTTDSGTGKVTNGGDVNEPGTPPSFLSGGALDRTTGTTADSSGRIIVSSNNRIKTVGKTPIIYF